MSIKRSLFESILIQSNDLSRTADITNGSVSIDYYEDIFSPTITAKIRVINTGNTIVSENTKDNQLQSLYAGLPLVGGERVAIKIAGNSASNPGLDFLNDQKKYLYVSSISDVIAENNRESFTLNLVSREAITNETTRVFKRYLTPIGETVKVILKDILKTNFKEENIEATSNTYYFIGNSRKPFTVLTWLASKGVPIGESKDKTSGFFFYQTVDGFQFKSIDTLTQQPVRKDIQNNPIVLVYSEATESYDVDGKKVDNDRKILNYNIQRNQNLIEKLRLGTYCSHYMFFNPLNFEFSNPTEGIKSYETNKNLGRDPVKLPKMSDNSLATLADSPTRIITGVLDIGTFNDKDYEQVNADPREYQQQSLMRYNVLFTQTLNVMIPSNTNLRAGDVIECRFPRISRGDAKEYDDAQTGLYMIKELCHHFDATNSYTSLKLLRDTFGRKENK